MHEILNARERSLLERGLDGAYAARALAVAGFLTPLGMIGFSWLADRGVRHLVLIGRRGLDTPGAAQAVAEFLLREGAGINHYMDELNERIPFKAS
jgi:hypothetical protein